jgi:DNA-binding IclR family transcriptional regulator
MRPGFAEHVTANHTYRLGPGALSLAAYGTRSAITCLAEPAMADLRNATGETVNLIGCTAAGWYTRPSWKAATHCGACPPPA